MPVPWRPPAATSSTWRSASPDFDTRRISEAAARGVLDEGLTHYGRHRHRPPARGDRRRRERWKGIDASPDQVVVTPGAKPIMFYAMLALIDEGDEVIYPNPLPDLRVHGPIRGRHRGRGTLREENDFRMDVVEVESLVTPRTRLIVINSPHNPTGSILTADDIRDIARIANEHDLVVLPMRSTVASSTRASRCRSPRCPAWPSARSPSTASARPSP